MAPTAPVGPVGPAAPVAPVGPVGPAAPVAPAGPAGPAAPAGPAGPVAPAIVGPTHTPASLITSVFPMDTELGWMSPFTSPARIAYGTLWIVERGVISASEPTVTPK